MDEKVKSMPKNNQRTCKKIVDKLKKFYVFDKKALSKCHHDMFS